MSQHLRYSIYTHWEFCSTGITILYVQTSLCYKLCTLHAFVCYIIFFKFAIYVLPQAIVGIVNIAVYIRTV